MPATMVYEFCLSAGDRATWTQLINPQSHGRHCATGDAAEIIIRRGKPVARFGRGTDIGAEMYPAHSLGYDGGSSVKECMTTEIT